jgi:diguanylate cyclase (GGDEF)-like protein
MKVINNNYLSIEDLDKNLDLSNLDHKRTLVQVFTGFVLEEEIKQIQSIIKAKNPKISFIGSTTAGEIFDGKVYENSINISIVQFDDTIVTQEYFIDNDDYKLGTKIAKTLFTNKTKATILFIDGMYTNGSDVLDGISTINNQVPLSGGLAGDNGYIDITFVFDKNGIYSKGVVAVSLDSDKLNIFTQYELNWQAIGQTMTVTKVEKNRLYEINGINVSEIYEKYLGKNVGDNLPYSATEFPLLKIQDDGLEVCRTFTHKFEDGSLLTIGNLEVGDKVRFAFGNIDLVLNNTKNNINKYKSLEPEVLFIYSCTSRRTFLQSEISSELEPLNKIAPSIGFFTYGEIFHYKNKNSLLNISLTFLGMSENNSSKQTIKKTTFEEQSNKFEHNFITNKHYLVLDALTNLTNTVISELEEAKQQLKDQANRDYLTGLYNRRYFNTVAQDIIHISKRQNKPVSVIMLDIDKFKNINDTYGHSVGDEVIKTLSNILVETTRKSDIVSRFGGEEFAILLPFTNKDGAFKIAQKIRQTVENKKINIENNKLLQFTISLGVDIMDESEQSIEKALNRADEALYIAKETGRNKVVVK